MMSSGQEAPCYLHSALGLARQGTLDLALSPRKSTFFFFFILNYFLKIYLYIYLYTESHNAAQAVLAALVPQMHHHD